MSFKLVDIIVFDVHTAVKQITSHSILKDSFRFLVDIAEYNERYKLQTVVETGDYIVKPLSKRELSRNHLWKNYIANYFGGEETNFCEMQLPFIFKPKNFEIKVNTGNYPFKATIETEVYLSTTGWSSNLKISLAGDIGCRQLQEFMARLRGKDPGNLPFLISGVKQALSSVFSEISKIVRKEIYSSPNKAGDIISVSNHFFISLQHITSSPKFYDNSQQGAPFMTEGERAELYSILYGENIKVETLQKYIGDTLYTQFRNTNFSLTNFDKGTLLYMQEEAAQPLPEVKKLKCLTSNTKNCTIMILSFLELIRALKRLPQENPQLKKVPEHFSYLLRLLKDSNKNHYCQNVYRFDGKLKEYQ